MKNYYDILGVPEDATQDEIKKSYRQLSKQYHPDVNPNGEEMFKEVAEAYETVGDDNKRKLYDNQKNNPFSNFGGDSFDFNSVFEQMMGGQRQQRKPMAADKILNIDVSPIESFLGIKKTINFEYYNNCNSCDGSGGEKSVCPNCNGQGFILQKIGTEMFQQVFKSTCNGCNGSGAILINPCVPCNGYGKVLNQENLKVTIPKNIDNGNFMRVIGKGDYSPKVKFRGDLILKVNVNRVDDFEKNNMDLVFYKTLNVLEIITKKQILIPHPNGNLMVNMPKNFNSEKPLRILNKGYSYTGGKGDLYIKVSVTNNYDISEDTQKELELLLKER